MKFNKIFLILILFSLTALLLHVYKVDFPCLNSDEAAFGYNTYSILKTGRDEYGNVMPLRFKSFGEYKLPVMGYLSLPFVAAFGLNEVSTRMVVYLIAIFSPFLFYALAKEITQRRAVALAAAFFATLAPWLQMTSRHAHEAIVAFFFINLGILFFLKFAKTWQHKYLIFFSIAHVLALFSHHITKPFTVFFVLWFGLLLFKHKKDKQITFPNVAKYALIFLLPIIFFGVTELMQPTSRINNLLFYKTGGFAASIEELRKEHDNRLVHNKVTKSVLQLTNQYFSYFSPEFLIINGDKNERFGFKGISPISPVEYVFLFIGLYFLFKNKQEHRYLLLGLLLFSPLSASISWQEYSLTRAFFMIMPITIISAYGLIYFVQSLKNTYVLPAFVVIMGMYGFFLFYSWEFYFHHYPQKVQALKAWQCGYKEVGGFMKDNYEKYDKFYVTRKLGQPYIYTLFYLKFPPEKYQAQANLTSLDEYGFGQIEKFDKFVFNFKEPQKGEKAAYIGYPEDFSGTGITESDVDKVTLAGQDMFWIYAP